MRVTLSRLVFSFFCSSVNCLVLSCVVCNVVFSVVVFLSVRECTSIEKGGLAAYFVVLCAKGNGSWDNQEHSYSILRVFFGEIYLRTNYRESICH